MKENGLEFLLAGARSGQLSTCRATSRQEDNSASRGGAPYYDVFVITKVITKGALYLPGIRVTPSCDKNNIIIIMSKSR